MCNLLEVMVSRTTVTNDPGSLDGIHPAYHQVDADVLSDITRCILGMALHSDL